MPSKDSRLLRGLMISLFGQLMLLPIGYAIFAEAGVGALKDAGAGGVIGRCRQFLWNDFNGPLGQVGWTFPEYVAFRIRHVLSLLAMAILAGHLGVGVVVWRRELLQFLNAWLRAPGSATNLAAFRVIFYGLLPTTGRFAEAIERSGYPQELLVPPNGWAWLFRLLPVAPPVVEAAAWIAIAAGALAALGFATRAAQFVCLFASFYTLTVCNSFGKVEHFHHLIWFQLVLLASPCAEVLSVDAWLAKKCSPAPSIRFGMPIRLIWILLGVIYFFPGFWKWRAGGLDWGMGENIANILHHRWHELGMVPGLRIDTFPLLMSIGGVGTMLFEMGFIAAIFHPVTRTIFAFAGLLFHIGMGYQIQIYFWFLILCYAVFIDWSAIAARLGGVAEDVAFGGSQKERVPLATAIVGSLLILGSVTFGILRTKEQWPLDCYPTFASMQTPTKLETFVILVEENGTTTTLDQAAVARRIGIPRMDWNKAINSLRWTTPPSAQEARLKRITGILAERLRRKKGTTLEIRDERVLACEACR